MDYKKYNDYELIYMVRENDDYSYGTLLNKYLPIIRSIAGDYYKRFDSFGYELDDFIQEGHLGFQKALRYFDEKKDILFYTFVTLCINRRLLSFCKRITCDKKNISSYYFDDIDKISIADEDDTELYFLEKEFYSDIWSIVYTYPIEYSCVFELRLNQFHYPEIERLLNISSRRAQRMMHILYKKIRKELQVYI